MGEQWQRSFAVLEEVLHNYLRPNVITYNAPSALEEIRQQRIAAACGIFPFSFWLCNPNRFDKFALMFRVSLRLLDFGFYC